MGFRTVKNAGHRLTHQLIFAGDEDKMLLLRRLQLVLTAALVSGKRQKKLKADDDLQKVTPKSVEKQKRFVRNLP
jgi:hypothetical protein